jgi:hypothetical protein
VSRPVKYWSLGLLLAAAAAARVCGAWNDLWLDEIWSLRLASKISSAWQVFTKIHHDNNHYLNTLWLYVCGFHGNWPGYRIPSILAGIGSVILAGMIGRRRNDCAGWFAMLLVAFSYVQILYSSEARGYGEVVFFSFLCFYALEKFFEKQEWQFALLFGVASVLGFLSHLIFLNFFGAALLWSLWRLPLKSVIACVVAPSAFLVALYFVDIRHQMVGGGTENGPGIYADSFAWTLGGVPNRVGMLSITVLAWAGFVAGFWILWREKSDSLIFFIGAIVVVPVALVIVRHSEVIYVRHFIVGMAFLLILFSFILAFMWEQGRGGRILCGLLLAGYFVLNSLNTLTLFKYGRGQYAEAATFMAGNTKRPIETIGGDHDFRIQFVLQFYVNGAIYYPRNSWPPQGPEWFIAHKESFADPVPPTPLFTDANSNRYEFVKTFPTAPLSGLHWFIYHNEGK